MPLTSLEDLHDLPLGEQMTQLYTYVNVPLAMEAYDEDEYSTDEIVENFLSEKGIEARDDLRTLDSETLAGFSSKLFTAHFDRVEGVVPDLQLEQAFDKADQAEAMLRQLCAEQAGRLVTVTALPGFKEEALELSYQYTETKAMKQLREQGTPLRGVVSSHSFLSSRGLLLRQEKHKTLLPRRGHLIYVVQFDEEQKTVEPIVSLSISDH